METIILFYSDGRPFENVRMPASKEEVAKKVIFLVNQLRQSKAYVLVDGIPYSYTIFPEMIAKMQSLYPMDLNRVWDALSEDILKILLYRFNSI